MTDSDPTSADLTSDRPDTRARVLVVDDDRDFAADIALVLGRAFEVRCEEDPDQAVALAREGWPDAVLLDIEFPDHDGLDVLQELQAIDGGIPVVMLTSHTGIPLVVAAMRAGAVNFVAKAQTSPEIVLETVHHDLRQSEASRRLSYLQAVYDYNVALSQLETATGATTPIVQAHSLTANSPEPTTLIQN